MAKGHHTARSVWTFCEAKFAASFECNMETSFLVFWNFGSLVFLVLFLSENRVVTFAEKLFSLQIFVTYDFFFCIHMEKESLNQYDCFRI